MAGKVYIVGAGPGDKELLTVKAARLLGEADALLYDRLVNRELLDLVKPSCKKIYVGKEHGNHSMEQDEINQVIYTSALNYAKVVRLKGGDPHVFGRGGEEELYLRERDIEFEIVPGISSSIAAAAYAGIPVSHRGLASSFTVVTGHKASNTEPQLDYAALAKLHTLIFLMAVENRHEIARSLITAGRSPTEKVAFIVSACSSKQQVILGELIDVAERKFDVPTPAVMVVGAVVGLSEKLAWFHP